MVNKVIDYIFKSGNSKRGRASFEQFLKDIGNPHLDFKSVQVVGTNGKGSTTQFLQSLLRTKYDSVATFTSPTVKVVYDRIRINNEDISEHDFVTIFMEIEAKIREYELGFFEILTAIAFKYFSKKCVDYAIIEAGIGGISDCTSIVDCDIRLLTTVGIDHVDILGSTKEEICLQKLGALKENECLVTTVNDPTLIPIIENFCLNNKNKLIFVSKGVEYDLVLNGEYQKFNAALALECSRQLGVELSEREIINAFSTVTWPGRMEKIADNFYLDGAHNKEGLNAALDYCDKVFGVNNYKVVFSCLKDKDLKEMYKILNDRCNDITFTSFEFIRAYTKKDLDVFPYKCTWDYPSIVEDALREKENYLFVGSLYFVFEIHRYLEKRNCID